MYMKQVKRSERFGGSGIDRYARDIASDCEAATHVVGPNRDPERTGMTPRWTKGLKPWKQRVIGLLFRIERAAADWRWKLLERWLGKSKAEIVKGSRLKGEADD